MDRAYLFDEEKNAYDFKSSAHCMNVSDLWYEKLGKYKNAHCFYSLHLRFVGTMSLI